MLCFKQLLYFLPGLSSGSQASAGSSPVQNKAEHVANHVLETACFGWPMSVITCVRELWLYCNTTVTGQQQAYMCCQILTVLVCRGTFPVIVQCQERHSWFALHTCWQDVIMSQGLSDAV